MSERLGEERIETFYMVYAIKNFEDFEDHETSIEKHFGLEWCFKVFKPNDNDWAINAIVDPETIGEKRNRIDVQGHLSFLKPSAVAIVEGSRQNLYDLPGRAFVKKQMDVESTEANHMDQDTVEIRCDVTLFIKYPFPKLDFFTPSEDIITDVALLVEERTFNVCSLVLASFSTYFRSMFFQKFKESTESIISLENVCADDFQELLEIIYHKTDVTIENAREILELVSYFDMKNIKEKCEKVLVNSSNTTVHLKEKLILADKYVLPELLEKKNTSFATIAQLKAATPKDVTKLSSSTITKLFQRVVDLPN